MSKSKKEPKAPYSEPRKPIRLFVLHDEHKEIRLAAAAAGLPMSEFCREAVLKLVRAKRK